jgi:hypothetical protein
MNDLLGDFRPRRHAAMEPTIWVAIALSALVHAAILSKWLPEIRLLSPGEGERGDLSAPLVVNLVPPRIASPAPPPAPPPAPKAKPRPPAVAAPPPPAPPVIALKRATPKAPPAPVAAPPSPPPAAEPKPAPRPAFDDLASYIEAKRRARAASAPAPLPTPPMSPPVEDENTRAARIVAQNLGSEEKLTFGYDPDRGGGVFQIQLMSDDYAEFTFIGWNQDIRRITKQLVEVPKGNNADIRIAIVRRMIAIIREHVQEDFLWESKRLGYRTLSARPKDNKGLEDFLMREFFGEAGPPR